MTNQLSKLFAECRSEHEAELSYSPRLFRLTLRSDAAALEELLRVVPRLQVCDTLDAQLHDLLRTRHPAQKLNPAELDAMTREYLRGWAQEAYGVWVYYPWSQRLVHLLDEAEFAELRTNRNQYKITPEEQAALAGKRVGVVGLSVGQAVAVTMALELSCGELRLADFDRLDLSNLNRLRAGVHELGLPKVLVTARAIAELDPFLRVVCFPAGIDDENCEAFLLDGGKLDVVVEECDSLDIKLSLRHAARRHTIPVVMNTSDRGLVDVERFDLEPDRPIFHGLIGDLDPASLRGLTMEEKVPYVLNILGEETLSTRLRASLLEVEQSICTWPQLASAVAHGGGVAADVARRICLNEMRASGRYFVDLETLIPNEAEPSPSAVDRRGAENTEASQSLPTLSALPPRPPRLGGEKADVFTPSTEIIERLIADAILAPSGGNTQPWRWLSDGADLHLFLDRSRVSALTDFAGCGAIVALGTATENLLLAAHQAGLAVELQTFPDAAQPDLAARFRFARTANETTEPSWRDELYSFLHVRHTNRTLGARQPLAPAALESLTNAVRSLPGADVQWLHEASALDECGQLVGAGDRLRLLSPALHRELMSELRWTEHDVAATRDGIGVATLACAPSDLAGLRMCRHRPALDLVRQWGGGRNLEKMSRKAMAAASVVGLLTMPTVRPADYFVGGRAVERLWLSATELGLAFHPMTTLPYLFARLLRGGGAGLDEATQAELRTLRRDYEKLFNVAETRGEIMLFRVSQAAATEARSRRRRVDEVLVFIR